MKISEINIGQTARYTKWITPGIVEDFIAICGDNNPVHVAGEKPIVHGMLIGAFISTLIGKHLPGDGAIWQTSKFSFVRPVYVWDKIIIIGEVTEILPESNSVAIKIDVFNENDDICVYCNALVKLPE